MVDQDSREPPPFGGWKIESIAAEHDQALFDFLHKPDDIGLAAIPVDSLQQIAAEAFIIALIHVSLHFGGEFVASQNETQRVDISACGSLPPVQQAKYTRRTIGCLVFGSDRRRGEVPQFHIALFIAGGDMDK